MTADEIKSTLLLTDYLRSNAVELKASGQNFVSNRCPTTEHKKGHLCVTIDSGRQLFHCHDCKIGGDVIRWMALAGGKSDGDVLRELGAGKDTKTQWRPLAASNQAVTEARPVIDKIYQYHDELGGEVFQAIRLNPKSFRQRHKGDDGKWVWNMDGTERVLYRLPEVMSAKMVAICEGEKDADTVTSLGYCGTCNVGGAGKWLDGYTDTLDGKDVLIFGDNDKAGQDHAKLVFDSIAGKAKTVRVIKIPSPFKDVTEYVESFIETKEAIAVIGDLVATSHPFIKGIKLPIYTVSELEAGYKKMVNSMSQNSFSLSKWIPTLGRTIRPLICGELVFIIGDTGTGKTGLLSEIARSARPLPTLFFELELPPELLFERTIAAQTKMTCRQVETAYSSGDSMAETIDLAFRNLFICTESKLTLQELENYIVRSELKIGEKPKLVLLDYIQLVQGEGLNRREKVSDIAEGLKILAKSTRTIIICASQVKRPDAEDSEVGLHSAKETGSIENSCGLLIGAWRDAKDPTLLHLKVLKSTKGGGGTQVQCNFDGERMRITERSNL